jgi:hypothetical protein
MLIVAAGRRRARSRVFGDGDGAKEVYFVAVNGNWK